MSSSRDNTRQDKASSATHPGLVESMTDTPSLVQLQKRAYKAVRDEKPRLTIASLLAQDDGFSSEVCLWDILDKATRFADNDEGWSDEDASAMQ